MPRQVGYRVTICQVMLHEDRPKVPALCTQNRCCHGFSTVAMFVEYTDTGDMNS